MKPFMTVALAGNPNCGKTTIFNQLTGSNQHVGNYAGVTVEKKEGIRRFRGQDLKVVDLPGTYSLAAYSMEEVVTRNYIVLERPDVIIDVLDGSNLERNLYLAVQILELQRPVVLALNMLDVAKTQGIRVSREKLSALLSIPVVGTVGNKATGIDDLLGTAVAAAENLPVGKFQIDYGEMIEAAVRHLTALAPDEIDALGYPRRWLLLKLIENDDDIVKRISTVDGSGPLLQAAAEFRTRLEDETGDDAASALADKRYQYVGALYQKIVISEPAALKTPSDKIDAVLTNRWLGIPLFLFMMWLVFNLVFAVGAIPQKWIQNGLNLLSGYLGTAMPAGELKDLLVDGVIGGVGSVLSFVPIILLLFAAIAVLEDSGYMARAAFIMDRIMNKVGLHGKSFIPLLLGFGCSVPAIMGSRTLENPRDRLVTILVTPFMSCSARLPVYTLLCAAFFSEAAAGSVLFSIYLFGILLAIVVARILRTFLLRGDTEPFVMEMPPYRWPSPKSILIHMWERTLLYVKKAGTIILSVSIIIWFLTNYPAKVDYSQDYPALVEQVETLYDEQIDREVYRPLAITDLAGNPELMATVAKFQGIDQHFREVTADLKPEDREYQTALAQKEQELYQTAEKTPEVATVALRYSQLTAERQETLKNVKQEQAGEKLEKSYAGRIGKFLEPLVTPLGFNWKHAVSLFAGFSAKEVIVSTMATIYSVGDVEKSNSQLIAAIAADPAMNPLIAYTLMIFILIYSPCVATIAAIRRETNSTKWALFAAGYTTVVAWVMAFVIYHGGLILGLG